MHSNHASLLTPADVIHILRTYPKRWLIPALACGIIAAGYAVVRPAKWEASQALMVRDEAGGTAARPGKFQQLDDMKTVQETMLELAKSRSVLAAALAEVGPGDGASSENWPTDAAVAGLRGAVKLSPPKGAEFGKTEVFYLHVEAASRERAVVLAAAICNQLQARSQGIREQKTQGLVAELVGTVDLANAQLKASTAALTKIESHVGADLGELRLLNDIGGADSPMRRQINEIELELRQARTAIEANEELLEVLAASKDNPNSLVAAPNRLLDSQPALKRLKDGLVDAQLRTAQLAGNLADAHPTLISAKIAEQEIAGHVRQELASAIRGVQVELNLSHDRVASLEAKLADTRRRLATLATMRADYSNLVAERNHRADIVKTAEQHLAEARASQAGAKTASLITAIDTPVAGDYPVGPGKASLVLGGLIGGGVLGLGVLFLTVPTAAAVKANGAGATQSVVEQSVVETEDPTTTPSMTIFRPQFDLPNFGNLTGNLNFKQALRKLATR